MNRLQVMEWGWRGLLVACVVVLGVLAVLAASRPISVYQSNTDPQTIVRLSQALAHDWTNLGSTRDPPLRYVPLGFVYTLLSPTSAGANRIAMWFTAGMTFVVTPLTIYHALSHVTDRWIGVAVFAAVTADLVVEYTVHPYRTGAWHYEFVAPFVFLSLATAHDAITSQSREARRRYAIFTGGVLGLLGLQQLTYAALAVLAVSIAFAVNRRWNELGVTYGIGGLGILILLSQPAKFRAHIAYYIGKQSGGGGGGGVLDPLGEVVTSLGSPGILVLLYTIGVLGGLVLATRQTASESGVILSGVAVFLPLWVFGVFSNQGYFAIIMPVLAYPLLVGGVLILGWRYLRMNADIAFPAPDSR